MNFLREQFSLETETNATSPADLRTVASPMRLLCLESGIIVCFRAQSQLLSISNFDNYRKSLQNSVAGYLSKEIV